MKKFLAIILGVSIAMLSACGGESTTPDNQATVLENGQHSALKDVTTEQYHNQADFQAGWDKLYAGNDKPALPTIDFTKNSVVMFALGEHKSSGYKARVVHAEAAGAGFTLGFEVTIPGVGCHGTNPGEITRPFIVVSIPTTTDANIEDPVQKRQPDCTAK